LEGERKQVTVLFADMVDSMLLAEKMDAEEWHRVLDRFFQILAEGVHRFEGTINQFTGDGIMALFGAPVAHEDHARRACHAALQLRDELQAAAPALVPRGLAFAVRMGLNSGEVVVGKIGDDLRMDYTAQGHSVGLAARMQQRAAPGTIFLTGRTAALVEGFFTLRHHGAVETKGVSGPVDVFELEGPGPLRTRLDASSRRGFSRLVGREAEIAWLDGMLDRAADSNGQVVGLVGDAGVGKSRLCLEFANRSRARGIAVHEAHCPAHGAAIPLLPIRDLLRGYLALGDAEPTDAMRHDVSERLIAVDPACRDDVPFVLHLLGAPDPEAPALSLAAVCAGLGRILRSLSRGSDVSLPVVLSLDDAHWIDPASEELFRELAASLEGTKTLLLANFRPEYRPAWIAGPHGHVRALSPLGREATRELLDHLLGSDASVADLSDRILERTAGNPFFVEEIVQALAAADSLAGERGAYRLTAPAETLALPETVQSLLGARIDRLGEGPKHLLQAAAVIGKEFDAPLLQEIGSLPQDEFAAALAALEGGELVHGVVSGSPSQYAFRHPLTREVAYHSLLGEQRSRLHAAVAAGLEKLHAGLLGEHASLIAHHWEASGLRYEAARWQRRAALKVSNIKVSTKSRRGGKPPWPSTSP
jgi:class 3 adenylate cyclase